jgi:hypothetical protein
MSDSVIQELSTYFSDLAKITPINMQALLETVETNMPDILAMPPEKWKSVKIEAPGYNCLRAYQQLGNVRVSLNIFPEGQAASESTPYLPATFALGMRVLEGEYEQRISRYSSGMQLNQLSHAFHKAGDLYTVNDPGIWYQSISHPAREVVTLSVTYRPPYADTWIPAQAVTVERKETPLEAVAKNDILARFQNHYPRR